MSSGALPGFVTGQFFASGRVSGEAVAAGVLVPAIVWGGGVGLLPAGDATTSALGLGSVAGEHAASDMLKSRRTAEVLTPEPHRGRIVSITDQYTCWSRPVPASAFAANFRHSFRLGVRAEVEFGPKPQRQHARR
jgi:hypothetical protein